MSFTPNRNITVNSVDTPDYVPNPQRDPTGYSAGRSSRAPGRSRVPLTVWLAVAVLVLASSVYALYRLTNWIAREYATNDTFSGLVLLVLYVVVVAVGTALAVAALSLAFGVFGWAGKRGLFELPGAFSVHVLDALLGWRRASVSSLASETMARHYSVQDTLAAQSQYRNVTSYSPSINVTHKHDTPNLPGGDILPALPSGDVPPFDALLASGLVGPDAGGRKQPLIFGYAVATSEPLTGDWRQLYSAGIGGLQGSGKTWSAAFLLAQSALNGARLVVCDPHAGDEESLASRVQPLQPAFACDIAEDDAAILEALRYAESVLKQRKQGDSDRTPLIVALDEWTALRRGELAERLPAFVESFSTEGRKLNCHALLLAQRWDKRAVGDFRNTLASAYVHRLRADEARMLTGLRAELLPKDALQLAPGQAYLLNSHGQVVKVAIPRMTYAAMERVGQQLRGTSRATSRATFRATSTEHPMGFQPPRREVGVEVGVEVGSSDPLPAASQAAKPLSPIALRVCALLRQKKSQNEIIRTVWGATSGHAYMAAAKELRAIIAEIVGTVEWYNNHHQKGGHHDHPNL